MATDPNWLYSTIAQSSAAIVAIIGGFITATVLTLSAERRNLKFQWDLRRLQLQDLDEQAGSKTQDEEDKRLLIMREAAQSRYNFERLHKPRFLLLGIVILAYLSIVGIIIPIIVIGYEIFNTTLRNWVIILFSLGIFGIFIYLILLLISLRRLDATIKS